MKRYTFEVVVEEGDDEFWEELDREDRSGCDEVLAELRGLMLRGAMNFSVQLVKYDNGERIDEDASDR